MKNVLLLACLITLFTSSCKKWQHQYPEDEVKTKLSPTERLVGKWWRLNKATLNGIDYTDSVYNLIGEYKFYLTDQNNTITDNGKLGTSVSTAEGSYSIFWLYYNNESDLYLRRFQASIFYPTVIIAPTYFYVYPNSGFSLQYTHILKLTENELKLKLESKSGDSIIVNEFTN